MSTNVEPTKKGLLYIILPILLTTACGIIDNSIRWRAEMSQKQFDRQTRILDKIMEIENAEQRKVVAQLYIDMGIFETQFRQELEVSMTLTNTQVETSPPVLAIAPVPELEAKGLFNLPPIPLVSVQTEPPKVIIPDEIIPTDINFDELIQRALRDQRIGNKTIFSFDGAVIPPRPINSN